MTKHVFLHYTRQDRDRNFDQRGWVPNALEVIARYTARSRDTRERFKHTANVPYGPGPDEIVDIFPAPRSAGHVQIFVHGGAWKNFTKDDYSFLAAAFVPAGLNTVIVNFTNLPNIRLSEMIDQVRRHSNGCTEMPAPSAVIRRRSSCRHSLPAHIFLPLRFKQTGAGAAFQNIS